MDLKLCMMRDDSKAVPLWLTIHLEGREALIVVYLHRLVHLLSHAAHQAQGRAVPT